MLVKEPMSETAISSIQRVIVQYCLKMFPKPTKKRKSVVEMLI